jgi:8-oxo-dGTP pyrophosphatase MutT (NUDIX family)
VKGPVASEEKAGPDQTVVAAVFLLLKDGSALMQHRDDKPGLRHAGKWVPPGGHCDPGEEPHDAARREMLEETGYHCRELQWLGRVIDQPDETADPYLLEVFWTLYDGIQPVQCFEGQEVRFLEREQAAAFPIPQLVVGLWDKVLTIFREKTRFSSAQRIGPHENTRPKEGSS